MYIIEILSQISKPEAPLYVMHTYVLWIYLFLCF